MSLYPDNDNRLTRVKSLMAQCAEFQVAFVTAKKELEDKAKSASKAFYDCALTVEPAMPPYEDWATKEKLVNSSTYGKFTAPEWSMLCGGGVAGIFTAKFVSNSLEPLLNAVNIFGVAGDEAAVAGSEAAAEEIAEAAAMLLDEAAGIEAGEVTSSLMVRFLSGAGGAIAGAVLAIVAELVTEAIDGAKKRDKLRGLIKDTFQARTQLKLLKDQFEELKAHLSGFADAYIAQKEISTPDDPTDMRHLQKLSDKLVENFKTSFTLATREQAIKELKNQDAAAGEWTSEDPEYPSGAQK